MLYVFDTSSFRVIGHYYPDGFPTFWQLFDKAVDDAMVVSVREVYNELDKQVTQEWFRRWIKRRRAIFHTPTDEETEFVSKIFQVAHFQTLVGEVQRLKGQPVADPFVIATAKVKNATVVTEEVRKPNAAKIPNICEHFAVECVNLEDFLSQNKWQF